MGSNPIRATCGHNSMVEYWFHKPKVLSSILSVHTFWCGIGFFHILIRYGYKFCSLNVGGRIQTLSPIVFHATVVQFGRRALLKIKFFPVRVRAVVQNSFETFSKSI